MTKPIPIYSFYPADSTPAIVREIKDRETALTRANPRRSLIAARDDYPALPWAMHELVGSTWRNAHTFGLYSVTVIEENKWGRPCPYPASDVIGLGFWDSDDRFITENWCRVDHLPPEDQVAWARARVAYCRRELAEARETLVRVKAGQERGCGLSYQKNAVDYEEKRLQQAQAELEDLAAELGVALGGDVRNVGAQPGDQLVLL